MKIACIISTLSKGGGTVQLLQLVHHLSKHHGVTIFTYTDSTDGYYKKIIGEIPIIVVKQNNKASKSRLYQLFLPYIRSFHIAKKVYTYGKFDILNPHEYDASWAAVFVKLVTRTPILWMCNDVWHIPGFEEKKEKRKLFKLFHKAFYWWTDYLLIQLINTIVVLDNRIKGIIKKKYNQKSIIIRSGVDLSLFSSIPSKKDAKKKLELIEKEIFLCMSIFFHHRRFEDALVAFSHYVKRQKDARLVIIGDTSYDPIYYKFIEKKIDTLGLKDVVTVVPRFITEKEKLLYLAASDIYIFPNEKQTWGLSVIEAMAAGKYCIVSDGAGVHEIINEKIGVVYPCGDTNALLKAMRLKRRLEMGKDARQFVFSNFSWDTYSLGIEKEMLKIAV